MAAPFPVVSLFAVYSTSLSSSQEIAHDSDQFNEATIKEDDATLEARKILYFYSVQSSLGKERKARLMGTVIAMANFAKMLSPEGAPSVRSVHSTRQRMVWLEPEPGYYIHATIDLPRVSRTHSRVTSSATASSTTSRSAASPNLEDDSIWAALKLGHDRFRLLHGSFASNLDKVGKEALMLNLTTYWNDWIRNWSLNAGESAGVERILGGLPGSTSRSSRLSGLITQFIDSNQTMSPIILHDRSVLHLPPPSSTVSKSEVSLSTDDLTAIVNYLLSILPTSSRPKLSKPRRSPSKTSSILKSSLPSSKSNWNTMTFGMGDYLVPSLSTLAALPGVQSLSNLSMTTIAGSNSKGRGGRGTMSNLADGLAAEMREEQEERKLAVAESQRLAVARRGSGLPGKSDSGSTIWGLRSVSWSGLIGGTTATNAAPTPPKKTSLSELVAALKVDSAESIVVSESTPAISDSLPTAGMEGESVSTGMDATFSDSSTSQSPTLFPNIVATDQSANISYIDVDSLSAALDVEAVASPYPLEEEGADIEEMSTNRLELFTHDDRSIHLTLLRRASLTLALITPYEPLDSQIPSLITLSRFLTSLNAECDHLMATSPSTPTPSYPHRHLTRTGLVTSSQGWSGKKTWSGEGNMEENQVVSALFQGTRGFTSDPVIWESFARTNASQWVVASKGDAGFKSTSLPDILLVLPPSKSGNDGLGEANEELLKLQRSRKLDH